MSTPRYEYSRQVISDRINLLTNLDLPYGLTVRYAVKANPFPDIIALMHKNGVHFDASSSYEASELLALGIPGAHISLSSQQTPHNLPELLAAKVQFVATSLHQLELFLDTPGRPDTVAVRINPDLGMGHNARTSTGGVSASFGIWYEYIPDILARTDAAGGTIDRLHLHIGSGADPKVWSEVMARALEIVTLFPDVTTLDIGGGYKVHRFAEEKEADMSIIAAEFKRQLEAFAASTGRQLALEIEPGTYFIAHAGTLVATIDDIVDTGKNGYTFLKLNTGMNDFLRTTMYGAQHKIAVINDEETYEEYVVVGHNCESGDIFTTVPGDSESVAPRKLKTAHIGDEVRIYDTGAYCASMRARGYNSFPIASEVMVD
ncbi:MAG: diaminopimelate decarboxylase [Candidatus Paceibacteria bacterium]